MAFGRCRKCRSGTPSGERVPLDASRTRQMVCADCVNLSAMVRKLGQIRACRRSASFYLRFKPRGLRTETEQISRCEAGSCQWLSQNSGRTCAAGTRLYSFRPREAGLKSTARERGRSVRRDAKAEIGGTDEIDYVTVALPARHLHQRGEQISVAGEPVGRALHG